MVDGTVEANTLNMSVVNPTTPANLFHLLRRQVPFHVVAVAVAAGGSGGGDEFCVLISFFLFADEAQLPTSFDCY